jgi:hypothetical protein
MIGRKPKQSKPALATATPADLTSSAAIGARIKQLRDRLDAVVAEIKRLELSNVKRAAGTAPHPKERAARMVAGHDEQSPTFAEPSVYLDNLCHEAAAIHLAIEGLNGRARIAEVQETAARVAQREPGRNEILKRITHCIAELVDLSLELHAYDAATGSSFQQAGGAWPELNVWHSERFMPRWLIMAERQKWISERELRSIFRKIGIMK